MGCEFSLCVLVRRYYNDLWEYSFEELKWLKIEYAPGAALPAPRGGCQLALQGDDLFMFGGFSVKVVDLPAGECLLLRHNRAQWCAW